VSKRFYVPITDSVTGRVFHFVFEKEGLALICRAAAINGIPFEIYLTRAAVRLAIADLKAAREAGPRVETLPAT
jgi:hypothetical protein